MKLLRRTWAWLDDRLGISETIVPLATHLVPPGAKWSYVFGSAALFCLILQVVTGVALTLLYQPTSSEAYQSLEFISHRAPFGRLLRAIHYFGASGMVLLVGVHMLRVYLTASFKFPREMSWITGVFLLFLTLAMGFTGQLLRWDSNGVWSAVVAAEQVGRIPVVGTYVARLLLGGDTIGGQSLSRFYSYHTLLFPALLFGLLGVHLYLVLRNGISEPAEAGRPVDPKTYRQWYQAMLKRIGVPFWPNAAWRDILFGAGVILSIIGLALAFGPPELTQKPSPALIYTNPAPDWYLLPVFALFALMPARIESYVIFFGPVLSVLVLLGLPFLSNAGERSPLRRPWAVFGAGAVVVFMVTLLVLGFQAPWSPRFDAKPLTASLIHSTNPVVVRGANLFASKGCIYCHTMNGHGGHRGPVLTEVGRRLSPGEMQIRIVNGGGNMPAFGGVISRQELSDLVAFLQTRR
ncbi:MAG: cytochrome b N-terminal domain-containing protein [Janthinobacterium lividum]